MKTIVPNCHAQASRFPLLAFIALGFLLILAFLFPESLVAASKAPTLELKLGESDSPEQVVPMLKIVAILTILAVAPAILLMMTSFTRILIVLGFVRQALGTQTMPPNQVMIGLALFLTFFTMQPVFTVIKDKAFDPYVSGQLKQDQAFDELTKPLRTFMLKETRKDDIALFFQISKTERPQNEDDVPLTLLMPAFMISELKTSFQIGFLIYVPFLVIDMVISSILMAMGMMMLPPTVVSLPFKLILFVLVDGWSLVVSSLVRSFQIFN